MKTLVPDYYKRFKCKCGDCRHCCCNGWTITLSYLEYCKLLGIECSEELRHKLDCAFYYLKDGDSDRYAGIKMNYFGNCPLQREDGYCALQCECGEESLPIICKMYPRNVLIPYLGEGACANSCEKVVELLIEEEKLSFEEIEIKDQIPMGANEKDKAIQMETIKVLQDRSLLLEERLIKLGSALGLSDFDDNLEKEGIELFHILLQIIKNIESFSPNFAEYSIIAKEDFAILEENNYSEEYIKNRYLNAQKLFFEHYPECEKWFENIMINHLFFERFPFSITNESIMEEYAELCGVFVITKFILFAYTEKKHTKEDFVDCTSGLFRCFEHSNANNVIKQSLKQMGKLSFPFVKKLISNT